MKIDSGEQAESVDVIKRMHLSMRWDMLDSENRRLSQSRLKFIPSDNCNQKVMEGYRINYIELFDNLIDGNPYKVKSEYRNLAIQFVRAKFGFQPEVQFTIDGEYAIVTL